MNLRERAKYVAYRTPVLRRAMAPTYPYKVNPAQLAAMVSLIDATRGSGAAVAEVGVAQGDSSVFLLEHLVTTGDERLLQLFDTFEGFTADSVEVEIRERGKDAREYDKFRYGDEERFVRNLNAAGYRNFRTVKGDASAFDWSSLGGVAAVLLDIDLYAPTLAVLEQVFPLLVSGGGVVLDDCLPDSPWDGSLQACEEFCSAHGVEWERVGLKGALLRA